VSELSVSRHDLLAAIAAIKRAGIRVPGQQSVLRQKQKD